MPLLALLFSFKEKFQFTKLFSLLVNCTKDMHYAGIAMRYSSMHKFEINVSRQPAFHHENSFLPLSPLEILPNNGLSAQEKPTLVSR